MAFPNRVGNLLKQNVSKHVSSVSSASSASLFQAIRCRSFSAATKLFVEDFPFNTNEDCLREEFSQYGSVLEVRVFMDRETDKSRLVGFVTYDTSEAAFNAIKAFDDKDFKGSYPRVKFATEKLLGGDGYGGGGGYGGRGGYDGGSYGGQGGGYGCGGNQDGGNYSSGDGNYGNNSGLASLLNDTSGDIGGGNYFGNKPNLTSLLNDDTSGAVGGTQGPLGGDQGEIGGGNYGF